jgi:hypothetical protein
MWRIVMLEYTGLDASHQTMPMTVANVSFMIDRLGADCHPLQYLRELTQNAIEALEGGGEVAWDTAWNLYDLNGQFKLAVIDNGIGMTGREMLVYINQLSSSSHVQSHDANYGVGAKVAGATRNQAGMIYLSWKDGQGWMIHLWRDPNTGEYGVCRQEREDGTIADYRRISDDLKPAMIGTHGTMVVLLGNDEDENTMEPGADTGLTGRRRWITKYLNTRYFRFPEGVEVKVREGYDEPRDDTRRNFLRNVTGMEKFLGQESEWYGTLPLTDATAHIWILNEREARTKIGDMYAVTGHIAALHKDELYELTTGRTSTAMLQQFGVIFGHKNVVIYIEPHDGESGVLSSNTARTQLLRNGTPLPWTEWAAEFRENLPDEIKELIERIAAGSTTHDHQKAIRERLKSIRDLFKITRYRRAHGGPVEISGDAPGGNPAGGAKIRTSKSPGGGQGGRAGSIYALFAEKNGEPGEEVPHPDPHPQTRWISLRDGTRPADQLDDRAAQFLPEQNTLIINADFRIFTDMVERWARQHDSVPGAREVIEETVREWFEQALVETVVGAQGLQGSPCWTAADINMLWSEEGLTAAVLQRYHVDNNVKRVLGTKLGSLKERTVA